MEKMHIVFDTEKCVGCFNCLLACQDEYIGNNWTPYSVEQEQHGEKWITTTRHERGRAPITEVCFVTEMCRHCDNAPCIKAHPDCFTKRDDGIVLMDINKARGNKALLRACPYGQIKWNEELQTAQKCTMCAHLLDQGWTEPRCVQACPLRALSVVKCSDEEFEALVRKESLQPLEEGGNRPRLMVRNAYKYKTLYVYGAVVSRKDGIEKAVEGAKVELALNGTAITSAVTDFFGEFKLDCLPKNAGEFTLKTYYEDRLVSEKQVTVGDECCDAGEICLD